MPMFLASLSLQATHDYSPLWDALKSARAQHLMDTTWLIDVSQDAMTTTDALLSHCRPGDKLFLLEFTGEAAWTGTGLTSDTKSWLGQRVAVTKRKRNALGRVKRARLASPGEGRQSGC